MTDSARYDAAVVGGGIAGLTAAVLLGRAGARTVVLEKAPRLGGRADTHVEKGFAFNLGPHAVYRGIGKELLESLIGPISGGSPTGALGLAGGRLAPLPASLGTLVSTPHLSWRGRFEIARFLSRLGARPLAGLRGLSFARLLDDETRSPDARALLEMLLRVASYTNEPDRVAADFAIEQLRLALRGVVYADGGWATLVSRLRDAARAAGVEIRTGARVLSVEEEAGGERVDLSSGAPVRASSVVLAIPPHEAAALTRDAALGRFADSAVPVKAAVLDVGLSSLPDRSRAVVLAIDEPLYLSTHSVFAALAPEGGATIHVARYLGARGPAPTDESELEILLDVAQPGWRDRVVVRRFLSAMTVAHALPIADRGGLAERPGPAVPGRPGLFVAGDWVGASGWLLEASVSSAAGAARLALARLDAPAAELRKAS